MKHDLSENVSISGRPFFPSFCQRNTKYIERTLEYSIGKPTPSNPHHLCNSFLTWHLKQLQKTVEFQSLKKNIIYHFILNWADKGGRSNKRNHYYHFFWWVMGKLASRENEFTCKINGFSFPTVLSCEVPEKTMCLFYRWVLSQWVSEPKY